jgi:hypothetical protein
MDDSAQTSCYASRCFSRIVYTNIGRCLPWLPTLIAQMKCMFSQVRPQLDAADADRGSAIMRGLRACFTCLGHFEVKAGSKTYASHADEFTLVLKGFDLFSWLAGSRHAALRLHLLSPVLRLLLGLQQSGDCSVRELVNESSERLFKTLHELMGYGRHGDTLSAPVHLGHTRRALDDLGGFASEQGSAVSWYSETGTDSDSDMSDDSDTQGNTRSLRRGVPERRSRHTASSIRKISLQCLQHTVRLCTAKTVHSYIFKFLPEVQATHPKPFNTTLITVLLYDPSFRVRKSAAGNKLCVISFDLLRYNALQRHLKHS